MSRPKPLVAVIEDDPASAEALSLLLRDWGADVVCDIAAEAIATKLGGRIASLHSIITDFDLGAGADGVAGARRLLETAPSARVLVLSGSIRARGHDAAKAAGFDMMAKPARSDAIIAWLERI